MGGSRKKYMGAAVGQKLKFCEGIGKRKKYVRGVGASAPLILSPFSNEIQNIYPYIHN